jgi:hypothetical protein
MLKEEEEDTSNLFRIQKKIQMKKYALTYKRTQKGSEKKRKEK